MPITPKQARFVSEYLIDLNATQAAIRAGYSRKTADVQGPRLLGNVGVAAAIAEGSARLAAKAELDAEEWRRSIATVARFDIRKIFDPETGKLLPIHELPDEAALCLASVKVLREKTTRRQIEGGEEDTEESTVEVKAWDKLRALEMAGKCLGQLKDRTEVTGKDGGPIKVERVEFVDV